MTAPMADRKKAFVHRHRWSHEKRRKQLRRALKDGIASIIEINEDGVLYAIPLDFKVIRAR